MEVFPTDTKTTDFFFLLILIILHIFQEDKNIGN